MLLMAWGTAQAAPDLVGSWQGTLDTGQGAKGIRVIFKVTRGESGYAALFCSIDQGGQAIAATAKMDGHGVTFTVPAVSGTAIGTLAADGNTISATWSQGGGSLPLTLTRATAATAWGIPEPPPPLKPMDPKFQPDIELAEIKLSDPMTKGKGLRLGARSLATVNMDVDDLIAFAYGVHPKQIANAPGWFSTDGYTITAKPNGEGQPDNAQWRQALQGLLASRFGLVFHREQRELSAYVMTVGKGGQKLTPTATTGSDVPALNLPKLALLPARNASMDDLAEFLQSVVLDRPVVNQTGIQGRYDFTLSWTPDVGQFTQMGVPVPAPTDDPNAPPGLFTAMQEQLGLKLEASRATVEVFVVDKAQRPGN